MSAHSDIQRYLESLSPSLSSQLTIVDPEQLGTSSLLHISMDRSIKSFIPSVSRRTANNEDRSIPRISTAPTLAGTILGHQGLVYDYNSDITKNGYRGGWYLYALPFEVALKPTKKLVYDANLTNEIWLVPYSKKAWSVPAQRIGRFFFEQLRAERIRGHIEYEADIILELKGESPLQLTLTQQLETGYWCFSLSNFSAGNSLKKMKAENLQQMTSKQFFETRKLRADMLDRPLSVQW